MPLIAAAAGRQALKEAAPDARRALGEAQPDECGAVWYFGEPRVKHVCHRNKNHRGSHHADSGLNWTRDPHHRQPRRQPHPAQPPAAERRLTECRPSQRLSRTG